MRYHAASPVPHYRPFPNVESRNVLQAHVEIPALVQLLPLPHQADVLEVGCGRGVALEPLARLLRPASLTGVDVDSGLLREAEPHARAVAPAATLVRADLRNLPFADGSFDLVVDFGTCYHVAGRARALGEIARVLRPGGVLVHETMFTQALSHPLRFRGPLPWASVSELEPGRSALFWATRRKR